MSSDDVTMSDLPKPLIKAMRQAVLYAMEGFALELAKAIKDKENPQFCNFYDMEIGVSGEPLISDTCPALKRNEMVVFIRFMEKFITPNETRKPRNLLVAVCLTIQQFPYVQTRIWELYAPRWEHEDMITTDPSSSVFLKTGVFVHVQEAMAELAKKSLEERNSERGMKE